MKRTASIVLCCILLCCAGSPAAAQELVVSAAASLIGAFDAIKAEFEKGHPEVSVTLNHASSGALFRQIQQGAPVDVFASADLKWMDEAVRAGLALERDVAVFAHNTLVMAVPTGNPAGIEEVGHLTCERVRRIGVGTPTTVPAGNYAMLSLRELGLWDALQPKMIFAESVSQILNYTQRGEVDAGIVYATDAAQAGERVRIKAVLPLPEPVVYPIAPLVHSAHQEPASKFIRYILSDRGRDILERYGFSLPE